VDGIIGVNAPLEWAIMERKVKELESKKKEEPLKSNSWQMLMRPDAQTAEKDIFKRKETRKSDTNRRTNKILKHEENMRNSRGCPRCPPHGGENAGGGQPEKSGHPTCQLGSKLVHA
jgi:hypothetical protein